MFPSPGDLPNPGIEPRSPTVQADTLPTEPPVKPHRTCYAHAKKTGGNPERVFILIQMWGWGRAGIAGGHKAYPNPSSFLPYKTGAG